MTIWTGDDFDSISGLDAFLDAVMPPEPEPEESWLHMIWGLALLAAIIWLVLVLAGVLG